MSEKTVRIAGVQYIEAGKVFDFDAGTLDLDRGDRIIVETDRGPTLALVAFPPEDTTPSKERKLKRVLRRAQHDDLASAAKNRERAEKAVRLAIQRARYYKLPLKIVTAEFPLSGDRVVFYFAAEERIDFRALVKDLGHELRVRVEMRQIGPRDVAKNTGGIGPCGRELCCSSWLREFQPVSIKMAKDQGLALNPQKVSGACGRLLCCLSYEHEGYVENKQGMPKVGKMVETPHGMGRVTTVDILNRKVRVYFEDGSSEGFTAEDVTQIKGPIPRPAPRSTRPAPRPSTPRPRPPERPEGEKRQGDQKQGDDRQNDAKGEQREEEKKAQGADPPKRKRSRRRRRRKSEGAGTENKTNDNKTDADTDKNNGGS